VLFDLLTQTDKNLRYPWIFGKIVVTLHARLQNKKRIMEARTMTYPQEGQLLVKVSDISMLKDIKKAISMVRGVEKVTLPHRKRLSAYERSLRDLEEGRVYEAKDVDDLFKQCLG
jgi:hypothetical protein